MHISRLLLTVVVAFIVSIIFLLPNVGDKTQLRTNPNKGIETIGSLQVWDGLTWGNLPIGEEGASLVIADGRLTWEQDNDEDKVKGNEILNVANGSPLVRQGSGTTEDPFVLDFRACKQGQVLMFGDGAWDCASIPRTTAVISNTPNTGGNNSSPLGDSIDGLEIIDQTITGSDIAGGAIGSSEIADGSIAFADVSQNGCAVNQIFKWDGSAWVCGTDNAGGGGANSFETITTPSGTSPVADSATDILTLAAGAGVTITGVGATDTITIAIALGTSIDSSEITDGTILFADLGQNSCGASDIIKWNGSAWVCGTDNVNDADSSPTNELQNIFQTIVTSSGTSPVADGTTDTLTFTGGSGVTITGDGTTDTVTVSAVLGTDVTSGEIVDGTIVDADVANGTLTFAKFAGNSCASGEVIEYNGSAWICGTDNNTTYSAGTGIGI